MKFTNDLTQAENIAETFGLVLGAASEQITEERLDSVTSAVIDIVLATADDEGDAEAADERFRIALEAGRNAARNGIIDPETAETLLTEMEGQLTT